MHIPDSVIIALQQIATDPAYIEAYYERNNKDAIYEINGADGGPLDGYGDDEPAVKALRAAFEALFFQGVEEYANKQRK